MVIEEIRRAIMAAPRERLADLQTALWKAHAAGMVGDDEAQALAELIAAKRATPAPAPRRHVGSRPISSASIQRRRSIAAAAWLPPKLACRFTMSEVSALSIIAGEVDRRGGCDLTIGEIAARAGCCMTVVRNALREARRLGLVTVETRRIRYDRNLPNVVAIVSPEWLSWLGLRSRKNREGGACRSAQPTKYQSISYSQKPSRIAKIAREFEKADRNDRARPG